jgi:glutaminyl-peptide cyclotransferase
VLADAAFVMLDHITGRQSMLKWITWRWVAVLCLLLPPVALWAQGQGSGRRIPGKTPLNHYWVVRSYPHDRGAFTQGLVYDSGFLYEGTGLYGRSTLRKVNLESGRVIKEVGLLPSHFGEGITIFGDRIFQITWQSRVGFVYDKASFNLLRKFSYAHEGWGITHDGKRLIMSDGTSVLHLLDPKDFHETGIVCVSDDRGPVEGLNELEYVRGTIYANVWPTNYIAVIHPRTGRINAWIDLTGLLVKEDSQNVDVPNGIAYDAKGDRLFVTGKFWPKLLEIKLIR